ncbi:hypothetical protein [Granulicoccus phenolivorans]|uniref:hypothetical protein n=1 Tax=Granulicoccus phenolivorans TaxID=266854 RepID=UPI0003FFD073|nr:hypothetical protein [Granulicoccus phenolivorans]
MSWSTLGVISAVFSVVILIGLLAGGVLVGIRATGRRRVYAVAGIAALVLRMMIGFVLSLSGTGLSQDTYFTLFTLRSVFDMLLFLGGIALLLMAVLTPAEADRAVLSTPAAGVQFGDGGPAYWTQAPGHSAPGGYPAVPQGEPYGQAAAPAQEWGSSPQY